MFRRALFIFGFDNRLDGGPGRKCGKMVLIRLHNKKDAENVLSGEFLRVRFLRPFLEIVSQ